MDTSSTAQMAEILVQDGRSSRSSWTNIYSDIHLQGPCGKDSSRKFCWSLDVKSTEPGMSVCSSKNKDYS